MSRKPLPYFGRTLRNVWCDAIDLQADSTPPPGMTLTTLLSVAERGFLHFGDDDGTCIQASITTVARRVRVSHTTVSRARTWLIQYGFLHMESLGVWYPGGLRNGKPAGKAMWTHLALPGVPCQWCPPADVGDVQEPHDLAGAGPAPGSANLDIPGPAANETASETASETSEVSQPLTINLKNLSTTTTSSLTNGAEPDANDGDGGERSDPPDDGPPTAGQPAAREPAVDTSHDDGLWAWAEAFRNALPLPAQALNLAPAVLKLLTPWHAIGADPTIAALDVADMAGPGAGGGVIFQTLSTMPAPTPGMWDGPQVQLGDDDGQDDDDLHDLHDLHDQDDDDAAGLTSTSDPSVQDHPARCTPAPPTRRTARHDDDDVPHGDELAHHVAAVRAALRKAS